MIREKYNPDNIFKNHTQETKQKSQNVINETAITPYKKSVFVKIIDKLKIVFHIK